MKFDKEIKQMPDKELNGDMYHVLCASGVKASIANKMIAALSRYHKEEFLREYWSSNKI